LTRLRIWDLIRLQTRLSVPQPKNAGVHDLGGNYLDTR
jgi:hypothetical protein